MNPTYYEADAPGRCYFCKNRLVRVSAGQHRGKFAFARWTDPIGNAVVAHVSCADRHAHPPKTADWDRFAGGDDGSYTSAKKPAAP